MEPSVLERSLCVRGERLHQRIPDRVVLRRDAVQLDDATRTYTRRPAELDDERLLGLLPAPGTRDLLIRLEHAPSRRARRAHESAEDHRKQNLRLVSCRQRVAQKPERHCRLRRRAEADGPPSESFANEERGGDERDERSCCRSADAKSRDSETVSERRCRKNCGRDPARVPSRQRDADGEIAPTTELGPGSMRVAERGSRG